jgi:hypothetical protein
MARCGDRAVEVRTEADLLSYQPSAFSFQLESIRQGLLLRPEKRPTAES